MRNDNIELIQRIPCDSPLISPSEPHINFNARIRFLVRAPRGN